MDKKIIELHKKLSESQINYFELFGLKTSATFKEIETAYKQYQHFINESLRQQANNSEIAEKLSYLKSKGERAFEVLSDYKKKLAYETQGFKEAETPGFEDQDPVDQAKIIYNKAKVLYNQRKFQHAEIALKEAIQLDSDKAAFFHLLGLSQSKAHEKFRDAEQSFLKAVELESWNAEHYEALGLLFYSAKLKSKAESYFRKALELEPRLKTAAEKLEEIAGPQFTLKDKIKGNLSKVLPSFFKKK